VPKRLWIAGLSLWPGLAQVWSGQELLGLTLAGLFAVSLNLAVVARYVWTETFPPGTPAVFAATAAAVWLAGFAYTLGWVWLRHPANHRAEIDALYREATESYLQGQFGEARRRLERITVMDGQDADALMQLGTLFVRTEQPALARRAFRQCLEREGGAKWRWEIRQALAGIDGDPRRTT